MIYNHITELIGNTPLLKIDPKVHGLKNIDLYAKLELFNPFGSLKDRVAWAMIQDDLPRIKENDMTILESSSGNTAKALQLLASVHGVKFKTITNRIKVDEARDVLNILGATIQELPGKSDCYDPNDPNDPIVFINREIQEHPDKTYFTSQYSNPKNLQRHYETTGQEIVDDLGKVDYFFAGLGTTGSSRGAATKMAEANPRLKTIGVAAAKGDYIPGIRNKDEILEVGLFEPDYYEQIQFVPSGQAVDAMLDLVRGTGIVAGPTSGACYHGALEYLRQIDATLTERQSAVFIVCDRLEWYTSYIRARKPELFGGGSAARAIDKLDVTKTNVPEMPVADAPAWIKDKHPLIVDTRSGVAFKVGHLPGSIHIPADHLKDLAEEAKPFANDCPILFVCPQGEQSRLFAAYFSGRGYDAYSLSDGIIGWRDAGLALEQEEDDFCLVGV